MASAPMNKIERAHQMYREGGYEGALGFYTEALSMARNKPQKIALHSNRAACYLKLLNFKKAAEECTSVLELDHNHTGALMLRAQTLVTLKEYHSALFDVNRLIELNPLSEVYQNLQARLKTQLSLAPIPEAEAELEEELEDKYMAKLKDEEEIKEKVEGGGGFQKNVTDAVTVSDQKVEFERTTLTTEVTNAQSHSIKQSSEQQPSGWKAIPKPKGHSHLDYSRWDSVEDDSSDEEGGDDDDEDSQPQYRFRVRTVGVRPVK